MGRTKPKGSCVSLMRYLGIVWGPGYPRQHNSWGSRTTPHTGLGSRLTRLTTSPSHTKGSRSTDRRLRSLDQSLFQSLRPVCHQTADTGPEVRTSPMRRHSVLSTLVSSTDSPRLTSRISRASLLLTTRFLLLAECCETVFALFCG